jgi:hypothetical protein
MSFHAGTEGTMSIVRMTYHLIIISGEVASPIFYFRLNFFIHCTIAYLEHFVAQTHFVSFVNVTLNPKLSEEVLLCVGWWPFVKVWPLTLQALQTLLSKWINLTFGTVFSVHSEECPLPLFHGFRMCNLHLHNCKPSPQQTCRSFNL